MSAKTDGEVPPEVSSFRAVIFLAQHLRYLMDQRLAADGLTTPQAMLLGVIEQSVAPPSLSEVAEIMATSHQNVKQLAAILERNGFVETIPDPVDGRVRRLLMTRRCREYWAKRDASDFSEVARLFGGLTSEERSELNRLLAKLSESVLEARRGARPALRRPSRGGG